MQTKIRSRELIWALATLLILFGCGRGGQLADEAPEIQIAISLDPDPPRFGRPCQLTVTVLEADGVVIDGAQLEIKGDMTHAGMVPVVVSVSGGEEGNYTTGFEWTMAGDWILTVQAELPDGRIARRQFEIAVGIPGG